MALKVLVTLGVLLLAATPAAAQTSVLRGTVVDSAGASVPGASVGVVSRAQRAVTDSRGRFELILPNGLVQLHVQRVGYETRELAFTLPLANGDSLTIELNISPVPLASLVISGQREYGLAQFVTPETVRNIPSLGEPDVFRAAAVLPFATQPNDLKGRIHLAGGASDETAVYLDGHPMQNPFHLLGLLGAFNVAAIDHADVRIHHLPASLGGALSGVIDLETTGPSKTPRYQATLGLLSSSLTAARAAGPLDVLASGRVTYIDKLAQLADGSDAIPLYGFADAVVRAGFSRGEWTAQLLVYTSRDVFRERDLIDVPGYRPLTWGESLVGLRLNRIAGTSSLDLRASLDRATSELDERPAGRAIVIDTRRDRISVGAKYLYRLESGEVFAGADFDRFDHLQSWNARGRADELFTPVTPASYHGAEHLNLLSLFGEADMELAESVRLSAGIRSTNTSGRWWLAPRAAATYSTERMRFTAALNRRLQFDSQLEEPPEGSIAAPVFLLDDPRKADVAALSLEWLNEESVDLLPAVRIETFVKRYANRTFLSSTDSLSFPDFQRIRGTAVGASATIRKSALGGWFQGSYTYQRSREDLDNRMVPTSWDAPHAATAILALPIGRGWTLNSVYQGHAGRATTPVVARIFAPGDDGVGARATPRYILGDRNSIRVPAYHRVDFGARRNWTRKNQQWSFSAQILNLLYRQNAIDYDWQQYYARLGDGRTDAHTSRPGLPLVPTVNLEVRW